MKIPYHIIKSYKFKEQIEDDLMYFSEYGYEYVIITKKLTKRTFLDWSKETQMCELIRCDKYDSIIDKKVIESIEELEMLIKFFG